MNTKMKPIKYWEEKDYNLEDGTPCTEFIWPKHRLIRFQRTDASVKVMRPDGGFDYIHNGDEVLLPAYKLADYKDDSIAEMIERVRQSNSTSVTDIHVHVVGLQDSFEEGNPSVVFFVANKKLEPRVFC